MATESGDIEQVNHYYPFGGLFGESSGGDVQKYKYGGKELERMHGIDLYDFSARMQDPILGRFTTMDPMCEKYYSISPYVYCNNNPIKYVDPSRMLASPYYDINGEYLGVDENGFAGDIYITDQETFNNNSQNGVANSKSIQSDKNTVSIVKADLSNAALSSVYTHVLNQMSDIDFSRLYNGKVSILEKSVYNSKLGNIGKGYNNPAYISNGAQFHEDEIGNSIRVTVNDNSDLYFVEGIQNNLGIHEYLGHGIKGYTGPTHYKCYLL